MNVSQAEFQNMKEEIVKDLISRLMDERGLSMEQAFDVVYTSRLFEKLNELMKDKNRKNPLRLMQTALTSL